MNKFIEYLEMQIEGCKMTKAPYRDKIIYQLVLDEYKKQLTLTDVVKPFYCANKQEDFLEDCKSQCEECRLEVCEIKQ
jgi:hypothetical protein